MKCVKIALLRRAIFFFFVEIMMISDDPTFFDSISD